MEELREERNSDESPEYGHEENRLSSAQTRFLAMGASTLIPIAPFFSISIKTTMIAFHTSRSVRRTESEINFPLLLD